MLLFNYILLFNPFFLKKIDCRLLIMLTFIILKTYINILYINNEAKYLCYLEKYSALYTFFLRAVILYKHRINVKLYYT